MRNRKLAAIDIGSNSIKLAIVEAAASDSFTVTLQERERVRLGQDTLQKGLLSADAIARSAEAIDRFRNTVENKGVDTIIAVATASVREAENADDFVGAIEQKTGIRVEVLSAIEEARLIGIAAEQNIGPTKRGLLNVDIGGGSTELSLMRDGAPEYLVSMRLGAVGLTEKFLHSDPVRDKELRALRTEISSALERPVRELKGKRWKISTGTSGTILNLASLLNFTPAGSAAEPVIEFKRLEGLNKMMAGISTADRARLPIISQQRAEVIVAGGQILEGVMRELRIERLQACTWALREGVIIDHLRELEVESLPPVPDVEDRSLRGVFVIGRRFGYEEGHALQVARLAEKIFDAVSKDHGLQRHHRTLLSAAALLHDIGFHVSHDSHHKHSHYLIQHSELTGFSEAEKAVIGNVARYHRSSFPKDKHPDFAKLGDKDRDLVWKLGAILRLADALDRSYENAVTDLKMRREKTGYSLKLKGGPSLERELQAAERKKDMFETAYNCSVRLS